MKSVKGQSIYPRIALLGDSIFDNQPYVASGDSVIDLIKCYIPEWQAELLAVDGAVVSEVSYQCREVKETTTHIFVSCGGNDALGYLPVFDKPVRTVLEAMEIMEVLKAQFKKAYQQMIAELLKLKKHLTLCTIYDSIPNIEAGLLAALSIFNEVIIKEAVRHKLPIIDLRLVCDASEDYSSISPIEPSEIGGRKIIEVINEVIEKHDFTSQNSIVYEKSELYSQRQLP